MKTISLVSLILGSFILIFACGYEASRKRNLIEAIAEDEEKEITETGISSKGSRTTEFRFDFFNENPIESENMYTENFRKKAMQSFIKFDAKKIDELMERDYDIISSGVWNDLIKMKKYRGIKYLLTEYFLDNKIRRQTFRDAIIHGSTALAKFILANFESALTRRNAELIRLACEKKRYKILRMMASTGGFDINHNDSLYRGKTVLHNAVIANDLRMVKHLLKFNNIDINNIDDLLNTPLHFATDLEIVDLLLSHGADPNLANAADMDSISLAVNLKRNDLVIAMIPDLFARFDHFHTNYRKSRVQIYAGTFKINRQRTLEDSFYLASKERSWTNLKYAYEITFEGETGIDRGGLTREWMSLLIERLFVPRLPDEAESQTSEINDSESDSSSDSSSDSDSSSHSQNDIDIHEMFQYLSDDDISRVPVDEIQIYFYSPFECVDADNKLYRISTQFTGPVEVYKFIGTIIAKSLLWKNPLKVKLVPSIIKLLLGKPLTFEDLKDDDLVMYRSLRHCLETGFDFDSAAYTLPSDESVIVNAENVETFLNETAVESMYNRYKEQLDQLVQGFRSIISHEKVGAYFTPEELQNILSGSDTIDREDIYRNIQICGDHWIANNQMFWAAMDLLQDGD